MLEQEAHIQIHDSLFMYVLRAYAGPPSFTKDTWNTKTSKLIEIAIFETIFYLSVLQYYYFNNFLYN